MLLPVREIEGGGCSGGHFDELPVFNSEAPSSLFTVPSNISGIFMAFIQRHINNNTSHSDRDTGDCVFQC